MIFIERVYTSQLYKRGDIHVSSTKEGIYTSVLQKRGYTRQFYKRGDIHVSSTKEGIYT